MPPKRVTQSSARKPVWNHPPPFSEAPTPISSLLTQLDPAQVYITHIDRTALSVKKQVFTFALLLNASIAALLAWRAYVAIPHYLALGQTVLGYDSSASVDDATTATRDKIWILLTRTAMMLVDYLLARLVLPWPGTFFFERPANPVTWRFKIGFKDEEVVCRVCRNWESRDMMKGEKRGEDSPFFKTRILTAIDGEAMEKTGYLMMDGNWDLDFGAMQDAHTLLKQEKLKLGDVENLVLVYQDAGGFQGWLAWRFKEAKDSSAARESAEEENRKKLMAFKELLASKGKESLFWKWQQIVEEERGADGGFTTEGQKKVAKRVEEVFKKEGIDFNEAMESVGNVEALSVSN